MLLFLGLTIVVLGVGVGVWGGSRLGTILAFLGGAPLALILFGLGCDLTSSCGLVSIVC